VPGTPEIPVPGVFLGLPEGEYSPCRVLHDGHTARVVNVAGRSKNLAAKLRNAACGIVRAFAGNVNHPVRRHTVGPLLRTHGVRGAGVPPLELKHGVEVVRTHGKILAGPTKQRSVEALGGILIGGRKFNPTKSPWGMLVNMRHGAKLPPFVVWITESPLLL
jgi:hypothetical protein